MDTTLLIFLVSNIFFGCSSILVRAEGDYGKNRDFPTYRNFHRSNDESNVSPRCTSCGTIDDGYSNNPPSDCDQELYCTSKSQTNFQRGNIEELLATNFEDFLRLYNDVVLYKSPPIGTFPVEVSDKEACDSSIDFQLVTNAQTFPYGWAPLVQERNYFQYFRIERCTKSECNSLCKDKSCNAQSTTCRTIMNRQRVLVWQGDKVVSAIAILPESCKCVRKDITEIKPTTKTVTAFSSFDEPMIKKQRHFDRKTTPKRMSYVPTTRRPQPISLLGYLSTRTHFRTNPTESSTMDKFKEVEKELPTKNSLMNSYKQFDRKITPKRFNYKRTTRPTVTSIPFSTTSKPKSNLADFSESKIRLSTESPLIESYKQFDRKITPKRFNYERTTRPDITSIPSTTSKPKSNLADFSESKRRLSTESPLFESYKQFDRKITPKRFNYERTIRPAITSIPSTTSKPKSNLADFIESKRRLSTESPLIESYKQFDRKITPKRFNYERTTRPAITSIPSTTSKTKSSLADFNESKTGLLTKSPLIERYKSSDQKVTRKQSSYDRTTQLLHMQVNKNLPTSSGFRTRSTSTTLADTSELKKRLPTKSPLTDKYEQSLKRKNPMTKTITKPTTSAWCCDKTTRRSFDQQTTKKPTSFTTENPWIPLTKYVSKPSHSPTRSTVKSTLAEFKESKHLQTKNPLLDSYQSFKRNKQTAKNTPAAFLSSKPSTLPSVDDDDMEECTCEL